MKHKRFFSLCILAIILNACNRCPEMNQECPPTLGKIKEETPHLVYFQNIPLGKRLKNYQIGIRYRSNPGGGFYFSLKIKIK